MVEKSKVCEEVGASVLGIGRQGVVDGTRRAMGEGREAGGIDPVPGTSTEHPPPPHTHSHCACAVANQRK